jgi:hypothetical protein
LLLISAAVGAVALGLHVLAVWASIREWRRDHVIYHSDMARLCKEHERRLREVAARIRRGENRDADDRDPTDAAFALIRLGLLGNNSREVDAWMTRPPSPERTAVALKWAEYTAAESGANAARHELWKRDLERGLSPRHVTIEVPEPDPPSGWSPEDWKRA